jgi:hypothetical protein
VQDVNIYLFVSALPTSTSCFFSATLAVLTLAAMMAFKSQLASKEWMTILGGFLGSQFFVFMVTVSSFRYFRCSGQPVVFRLQLFWFF